MRDKLDEWVDSAVTTMSPRVNEKDILLGCMPLVLEIIAHFDKSATRSYTESELFDFAESFSYAPIMLDEEYAMALNNHPLHRGCKPGDKILFRKTPLIHFSTRTKKIWWFNSDSDRVRACICMMKRLGLIRSRKGVYKLSAAFSKQIDRFFNDSILCLI